MSCPFNMKFGKDHDSSDMCNLCKDEVYTECGKAKESKVKRHIKRLKPSNSLVTVKQDDWNRYGR